MFTGLQADQAVVARVPLGSRSHSMMLVDVVHRTQAADSLDELQLTSCRGPANRLFWNSLPCPTFTPCMKHKVQATAAAALMRSL